MSWLFELVPKISKHAPQSLMEIHLKFEFILGRVLAALHNGPGPACTATEPATGES